MLDQGLVDQPVLMFNHARGDRGGGGGGGDNCDNYYIYSPVQLTIMHLLSLYIDCNCLACLQEDLAVLDLTF